MELKEINAIQRDLLKSDYLKVHIKNLSDKLLQLIPEDSTEEEIEVLSGVLRDSFGKRFDKIFENRLSFFKEEFNTKAQIKKYLETKTPVTIFENNETGEKQFSVQVVDTDFWLDSFPTFEQAVEYCREHQLLIHP
jgi:hypothetical protein